MPAPGGSTLPGTPIMIKAPSNSIPPSGASMPRVCRLLVCVFLVSTASHAWAASPLEGFVPIPAGTLQDGQIRLEPFEILDHAVTNREYQAFLKATGFPAPPHWKQGEIPAGKEDYPVIFVNRRDVAAFLAWLSEQEGRPCRLPTSAEFEFAARGGLVGKPYPWGDEAPHGKANYDADSSRRFDRWSDYLEPARAGQPNGYGLYGMAGNVAHQVNRYSEPSTIDYKYRVENPIDLEQTMMGGSWALSEAYLRCGDRAGVSSAVRQPDLGFRPIRRPLGGDWSVQPRRLAAVSLGNGAMQLSWALLPGDRASTGFHVYRATERTHAGTRLTSEPLTTTTNFVDRGLASETRYQYYVRSVDAQGKEGARSEWVGFTPSSKAEATVMSFRPRRAGSDNAATPIFGDLAGDGTPGCVIRMANGNHEMAPDPGTPVQLEAFTSYGRSLWRKDICRHDHCFGNANNVPFNVWDMDGDGKAEVITRLQIGDEVYVAILNGMTGELLHKAPWPAMATDFIKSSTRIHLSIAYLDGVHPAVITQTGVYENEVFVAFDAQLKQLWKFDSFLETNGSGGHKIEVADVDGDGRQEVLDGTTCLNPDGTLRWSIYKMHPDVVSIHDHMPDHPGLEIFYLVETNAHAGAYMVEAASGKILWKSNRDDDPVWSHGHMGWSADIWEGSPGIECLFTRAGHKDSNLLLFSADGHKILEHFPTGWTPLEWDGDATHELINTSDFTIGDFDGKQIVPKTEGNPHPPEHSALLMVADLCGDFRDELVVSGTTSSGEPVISVVTATAPITTRYLAPSRTLDYRLWVSRNMGGGYAAVYTQPLAEAPR